MKKIISIIVCLTLVCSCVMIPVSAKSNKITVTRPQITEVTQVDTTTIKVKWSKVKNASGYVLYYKKAGGKYKKLKTLSKSERSYTHKKLTTGKKYFYKVKAYKKVKGKKYYSKFSNVVARKTTNYLMSLAQPYSSYDYGACTNGTVMSMGGDNYTNGFLMSFRGSAIFNLKGKYNKISFTIGSIDDGYGNISILSDDECVWTYAVGSADLPKTFTVNIENASKLEFKTECDRIFGYSIGVANIKVYK